ncbi:MAG: hypothetical protein NC037_00885 [Bacteroides sp.]|nr:hypothetical protein [Bacillota bacterium]MCM1393769.1 hypothetical protein [[Eubacterium] siraeum]MCM1455074.1 hypothetical protein [Bacteroides sp.]
MKKRMFFTSILTILLLLVALSTATFAWFSASNAVNVSVISFTASANDAEGGDLAIAWTQDATDSYEIDFAPNTDMRPMIPKNLPQIGQSYESFIAIIDGQTTVSNFHSSVQAYDADSERFLYAGVIRSEVPTNCKSADGEQEFYLINKNADFGQKITVKYEIDGENADALLVALFADDLLVGIMGGGENLYYGEITSGAPVDSQNSAKIISKSGEITFNIPKGGTKKMRLVAWYSGVNLDNDKAEKTAMLSSLKFVGDYAG